MKTKYQRAIDLVVDLREKMNKKQEEEADYLLSPNTAGRNSTYEYSVISDHVDKYGVAEAARRLGVAAQTIYYQIRRAEKKEKEKFAKEQEKIYEKIEKSIIKKGANMKTKSEKAVIAMSDLVMTASDIDIGHSYDFVEGGFSLDSIEEFVENAIAAKNHAKRISKKSKKCLELIEDVIHENLYLGEFNGDEVSRVVDILCKFNEQTKEQTVAQVEDLLRQYGEGRVKE